MYSSSTLSYVPSTFSYLNIACTHYRVSLNGNLCLGRRETINFKHRKEWTLNKRRREKESWRRSTIYVRYIYVYINAIAQTDIDADRTIFENIVAENRRNRIISTRLHWEMCWSKRNSYVQTQTYCKLFFIDQKIKHTQRSTVLLCWKNNVFIRIIMNVAELINWTVELKHCLL